MDRNVVLLFEAELGRRGLEFSLDPETGHHAIGSNGAQVVVCLDNLKQEYAEDGEVGKVGLLVDVVETTLVRAGTKEVYHPTRLFWLMEPNNHGELADLKAPVSKRVDRVLCHLSPDQGAITWVSPMMLAEMGLSEQEAEQTALDNANQIICQAQLSIEDIEGVRLASIHTSFPAKTSLLLAPKLRDIIEPTLGWPVLAVAPGRDLVYLWSANHLDFAGKLGGVVMQEFQEAAHPVSAEVYEISDRGLRAIGSFAGPE